MLVTHKRAKRHSVLKSQWHDNLCDSDANINVAKWHLVQLHLHQQQSSAICRLLRANKWSKHADCKQFSPDKWLHRVSLLMKLARYPDILGVSTMHIKTLVHIKHFKTLPPHGRILTENIFSVICMYCALLRDKTNETCANGNVIIEIQQWNRRF